ncbi:MAG: gfo/Idh/MocA family oxidoreductase [Chloroflexi bacterium]|nr:MAG: gfo/Idh/MocA family oxidoreductase [Chloroflexota bacterium]
MKILMVGLGAIGQRHLRNLRKLMGADLEILAYRFRNKSKVLTDDLKIEDNSNLEDKYNISAYTDLDRALAQKPDAVFVCNPSSLHIPTALKAAQAGCNLFIEKPLSHNLDQVEELINLVESQNTKAVVGYQMRFNPCLQRLHSILQEQMIGRVLSVRAEVGEYLPGWHPYEDYRHTYASKQDLGGGVLLSQIHELDYLYWLFGLPRRVYALGGHLSSLEVDVEDTAEILMDYEMDGRSVPVSVHQDYLQRPPRRTCDVIGDNGKILVNLAALSVDVFDGEGKQVEATSYAGFQRNQMFMDELKYFLANLRGSPGSSEVVPVLARDTGQGTPDPLVSVREAAHSLRMALAAKESLMTGKVVNLTR